MPTHTVSWHSVCQTAAFYSNYILPRRLRTCIEQFNTGSAGPEWWCRSAACRLNRVEITPGNTSSCGVVDRMACKARSLTLASNMTYLHSRRLAAVHPCSLPSHSLPLFTCYWCRDKYLLRTINHQYLAYESTLQKKQQSYRINPAK